MKKVLLIDIEDIINGSVIEQGTSEKLIKQALVTAQNVSLKPVLGATLFGELCDAVFDSVTNETILADSYVSLMNNVRPYLLAQTVADFIIINNYKVTNKGIQKLSDASSTSVSNNDLEGLKDYYDNLTSTYKRELIEYLKGNNLYKGSDSQTTFVSTGWAMEGDDDDFDFPVQETSSIDDYITVATSSYTYQQLNEINRTLLITVGELINLSNLEQGCDEKLIAKTLVQVQQVNLKPILGEGVFNNLMYAVHQDGASGQTISLLYQDLLTVVKPYLINKVTAEYCMVGQFKFTAKGLLSMNDNAATPLDYGSLKSVRKYYDNIATSYEESLVAFLNKHGLSGKGAMGTFTSTGWAMEGDDDCYVNTGSSNNTLPSGIDLNYYTTGATLDGKIVYFNTNVALSAYTLDLSSLSISGGTTGNTSGTNVIITGATFNNNNLVLKNSTGGTVSVLIDNLSGLTINGILRNGTDVTATAEASHAEGYSTFANGVASHAEGLNTIANYIATHAEGQNSQAYGYASHAEGLNARTTGNYSHGEGEDTQAIGEGSHAEGFSTEAVGAGAHSEGSSTEANGSGSHAEGSQTQANGTFSHAEGDTTTAVGDYSHAEGFQTFTEGQYSHVEGVNTFANSYGSHSEGIGSSVFAQGAHAEGSNTVANGDFSHAEGIGTVTNTSGQHAGGFYNVTGNTDSIFVIGNGTDFDNRSDLARFNNNSIIFNQTLTASTIANRGHFFQGVNLVMTGASSASTGVFIMGTGAKAAGNYTMSVGLNSNAVSGYSFAHGNATQAFALYSHAEGTNTQAQGQASHAEGSSALAIGANSHAEGQGSRSIGTASHAEGSTAQARGNFSHAEGNGTLAGGQYSHAEGTSTASGDSSHAEGRATTARGDYSHTEGDQNQAYGDYSHAEGSSTTASATSSHAEGRTTLTVGLYSHAEGMSSQTFGQASHAEGSASVTSGATSHAEGSASRAIGISSHAEGQGSQSIGATSHAEGAGTFSVGISSHSEGSGTTAVGIASHTQGIGTVTNAQGQAAMGRFNVSGNTSSLIIIGNGTSDVSRSDLAQFNQTSVVFFQPFSSTTRTNLIAQVFPDNTAALAGGLIAGDIYRTSTGQVMMAF